MVSDDGYAEVGTGHVALPPTRPGSIRRSAAEVVLI
jgi:hypothetical protein